jgi:hypothetical protein
MDVLSFDIGMRNLAHAKVRFDASKAVDDIQAIGNVDILKEAGCSAHNCRSLRVGRLVGMAVQHVKGLYPEGELPDAVVVERQRGHKEAAVAAGILGYFAGAGVRHLDEFSAMSKFGADKPSLPRGLTKSQRHTLLKKAAIERARVMLPENLVGDFNAWPQYKQEHPADALLQAVAWRGSTVAPR